MEYLLEAEGKDINDVDPNDDWYDRPKYDWWKDVFKVFKQTPLSKALRKASRNH